VVFVTRQVLSSARGREVDFFDQGHPHRLLSVDPCLAKKKTARMVPRSPSVNGESQGNDYQAWQRTPFAPPLGFPPAAPPLNELGARDHSSDTKMVPRGLVVGEVNEMFVCGICDGLLHDPRHADSCDKHLFCRVCYEAALSKEACCPTCKQPVDESEPLQGFGPFEAMVNRTVVRCPNNTSERGGTGGNVSLQPAKSREASDSSARSLGSVQAPRVKEEKDGGGGSAGLGDGGAGESESSLSPFDGVHVGAPSNIHQSCPGYLDDPLLNRPVLALQVTYSDLVAICKMKGIACLEQNTQQLLGMLTPLFKTSRVKPHAPAP